MYLRLSVAMQPPGQPSPAQPEPSSTHRRSCRHWLRLDWHWHWYAVLHLPATRRAARAGWSVFAEEAGRAKAHLQYTFQSTRGNDNELAIYVHRAEILRKRVVETAGAVPTAAAPCRFKVCPLCASLSALQLPTTSRATSLPLAFLL